MYQGINNQNRVVISTATAEQVEAMRTNPVYKGIRFMLMPNSEPIPAPVEVEDAKTTETDGDSINVGAGSKADRKKPR